jgi:hypothetical protein
MTLFQSSKQMSCLRCESKNHETNDRWPRRKNHMKLLPRRRLHKCRFSIGRVARRGAMIAPWCEYPLRLEHHALSSTTHDKRPAFGVSPAGCRAIRNPPTCVCYKRPPPVLLSLPQNKATWPRRVPTHTVKGPNHVRHTRAWIIHTRAKARDTEW